LFHDAHVVIALFWWAHLEKKKKFFSLQPVIPNEDYVSLRNSLPADEMAVQNFRDKIPARIRQPGIAS